MRWNRRFEGSLRRNVEAAHATGTAWLGFKSGLYRDVMPQPMTIYLDEYRKKQLPTRTL